MKKFIHWLIETKIELPVISPNDNRELIFGAYGVMKTFIPRISEFGNSETNQFGNSETNPYLLVVWDNKRKIMARGSYNCAVCKNYDVKHGTCHSFGDTVPAPQSFVKERDIGGCAALDFLPFFGSGLEQSKKYEGLQFALAKGYIFRYFNGEIKLLAGPFVIDDKEIDQIKF